MQAASSSRSVISIATGSTRTLSRPCRHRCMPARFAPRRTLFSLADISKLAGLSQSPREGSGVETDGDEQKFHARKILPYSQSQLYSLVSDVPSYSSFIPFCHSSKVLAPLPPGETSKRRTPTDWSPSDQPFEIDAELKVGFGGLEERYISKVVGRPFESVTATASEQTPLFNSLVTTWSFSPASSISPHPSNARTTSTPSTVPNATEPRSSDQGPTLLTIDLAFSFANPMHRIASQAVLPRVADKMVEAFEQRCIQVWGKGKE